MAKKKPISKSDLPDAISTLAQLKAQPNPSADTKEVIAKLTADIRASVGGAFSMKGGKSKKKAGKKAPAKSKAKPKAAKKAGKKASKKAGKKAAKKSAKKAGKKMTDAQKRAAAKKRLEALVARRASEKALRLAGGAKLKPALYKKKGKKACSRTRSGKCRTKGEVRLLATALKLDACKPGTLPTKFGRRAGEYTELMKYQTAPRQWMPAAYLNTITPVKREVLEVKLNAQGLPVRDKKTGAMIPKKWVSRPAYGKLVQLAKRLPPGGVRAMLTKGK